MTVHCPFFFSGSCRPCVLGQVLEFLPGSHIKLSGVDSSVKA